MYFKFSPVFFYLMFLMDVIQLFSSVKRRNRLISKGMSNIYLKVTIKKNWFSQTLDFLSLKSLSPGQFLESSKSCSFH